MSKYRNNVYYFIKLPDNFINGDEIRWIEQQDRGTEIVVFFLRLLIIAKNREGKLIRIIGKKEMPFEYKEIANDTYQTEEFVQIALKVLEEAGLVEYVKDYYYIEKSLELTNQTTEGAEYMREYRAKKKTEDYICKENCKTDIDKELEKRNKNKEIDIEDDFPYHEVIRYFNELTGSYYREDSELIINLMKVHVQNGFRKEDFIIVIDKKWREWKDSDMIKYMRPNTLFGDKFEEYLNQKESEAEKRYGEKDFESFYANPQYVYDVEKCRKNEDT